MTTYHNVSVSVITSGPVSGELQDSVSTCFLPTDQEPVLACINGRQGLSICIAVLHARIGMQRYTFTLDLQYYGVRSVQVIIPKLDSFHE